MSFVLIVFAILVAAEAIQLGTTGIVLWRLRAKISALSLAVGRDDLTGLPNRRGLLAAWHQLAAAGTPPGVVLLDLSAFKSVNDRWGHDAGDELLCALALRLDELAQLLGGIVGRLGGDEFVFLLPGKPTVQQLVDAGAMIRGRLAEPMHLDLADGPVAMACVLGLATHDANPLPGKPFRAADIALYYACEHRLPYAVYQPGMTYPAASDRHGPRLRDRHPSSPVAVFDPVMFSRLVAGEVSSDIAHIDDIAELRDLLEVLDPRSRDFGTDVIALVDACINHGALRLAAPVTSVGISPTTVGEYRDGGFLILVEVAGAVMLASPYVTARPFAETAQDVPVTVMTHVAQTVSQVYDVYRA